jgi:hypothetical protein
MRRRTWNAGLLLLVTTFSLTTFDRPLANAADGLPPLQKLKDHFAAGRVQIDKKTGEIALLYDFRIPKQMSDFEIIEGKAVVGKGFLAIEELGSVKHKARWKSVKMTCVAKVAEMRGDLMAGNEDVRITTGGLNTDTLYLLGDQVIPPREVRSGEIPLLLELDESRATVQWAKSRMTRKIEAPKPYQLELHGMKLGCVYTQLAIKGVPELDWLNENFDEDDRKK